MQMYMLRQSAVFGLAMITGAAFAQSLPAPLNVLPVANPTSALGSLGLPPGLSGGLPPGLSNGSSGRPSGSPSGGGRAPALPGLGGAPSQGSGAIPLGVTAMQPGANGIGPSYVLGLGTGAPTAPVIGNIVAPLVYPLTGTPSGSGPLAVGVIGGDGVANSAGGVSVAALSGNNNANGGQVGIGVRNGNNSGSGQALGVGALSGRNSGTSSQGLGVSVLNQGNPLGITAAGQGASLATLQNGAGQAPGADQGGIALGGGPKSTATSSNPLLNAGVLAGQNAGSGGGALGVAVLSGNNSANNAQAAGVSVLSGESSGNGSPVSVSLIGGNDSGNGSAIGVGVINGNNAGNGSTLGVGAINGNNAGNGGTLGAGVISGNKSGNGGTLGAGVINGADSGNGAIGVGVINGGGGNTGGGGTTGPGGTGLTGHKPTAVELAGALDPKQCAILTRDAQGHVVKVDKATCESRSQVGTAAIQQKK